jgi:alkyl hydroperoxide reductase subunit AhpC
MIELGSQFPAFEATACVRRRGGDFFRILRRDSFREKWMVYFFWPKNFTPVCATEIADYSALVGAFANRDAQIMGVSTDSEYAHWVFAQRPGFPPDDLAFPMLSDVRRDLCMTLGILDPKEGIAQRATFIVDPGYTIRHISVNDFSVGRSPKEILRILDALQTDDLCPSSWQKGDATMPKPTPSTPAVGTFGPIEIGESQTPPNLR